MRISDGSGSVTSAPPQPVHSAFEQAVAAAKREPPKVTASSTFQPKNGANLQGVTFGSKGSRTWTEDGTTTRISSTHVDISSDGKQTITRDDKGQTTVSSKNGVTTTRAANGDVTTRTDATGTGRAIADNVKKAVGNGKVTLYKKSGAVGASAYSKTLKNDHATLTVSALSAQASGNVSANISKKGLSADATGTVGVYAVDAKGAVKAGLLTASGDAAVGAGVTGKAQLAIKPGDVDLNGGVNAFAGAQANENATLGNSDASIGETAGVGVGVGVTATGDIGLKGGDLTAKLDLGGYVGVGGNVDLSVNVNPVAIGKAALKEGPTIVHDTGKVATTAARDTGKVATTVAGDTGKVATTAAHDTSKVATTAAHDTSTVAKSAWHTVTSIF